MVEYLIMTRKIIIQTFPGIRQFDNNVVIINRGKYI